MGLYLRDLLENQRTIIIRMFLIKADLTLSNEHREDPISGETYRPLLFFSNKVIRSGLLVLGENTSLQMDQAYKDILIKIYFHKDLDTTKEFYVGREFVLAEGGRAKIGTGIITEVFGEEAIDALRTKG